MLNSTRLAARRTGNGCQSPVEVGSLGSTGFTGFTGFTVMDSDLLDQTVDACRLLIEQ